MALDSFTKQSYESFIVSANFENNMITDETLTEAECTVTAQDKDGSDASSTVLDSTSMAVSGTSLQIRVKAGEESKSPYKITFKAVTSLNNKWEKDVNMVISEE